MQVILRVFVLFIFPPLTSSADTSSYPTPPQAIAERADERSSQEETGYHPPECHLGRYCISTGNCVFLHFDFSDIQSPNNISYNLEMVLFFVLLLFIFGFLSAVLLHVQARQRKSSATWQETL